MRNAYTFKRSIYGDKFLFTSVGQKGDVHKVVVFDFEEDGLYSVILGDVNEKGQLQSFTLTGNNDAKKVLATVADIIEYFIEHNPKTTLFFTGTTKRLTDLYKRLLLKEMD